MKIPRLSIRLALTALTAINFAAYAADDKPAAPAAPTAPADNTKKNERDRSGDTKTPLDQSNAPEDLKVTQDIRKALMADDSLSFTAKNVKIITANGKVTLRGPVNTEEEKKKITDYAKANTAKAEVVDQLEVKNSAKAP
jgi:hyperosmotically inducible protein